MNWIIIVTATVIAVLFIAAIVFAIVSAEYWARRYRQAIARCDGCGQDEPLNARLLCSGCERLRREGRLAESARFCRGYSGSPVPPGREIVVPAPSEGIQPGRSARHRVPCPYEVADRD